MNIIGKTEAEAMLEIRQAGMTPRVIKRDGIKQDVFNNSYDLNRVNIEVVNGMVVNAYVR